MKGLYSFICTILLLFLVTGILHSHIVFNQINNAYVPSISPPNSKDFDDQIGIDKHIINGATALLKATGKFQEILGYIETKTPKVDFHLLEVNIDTSIISLERARYEYAEICRKIVRMSQNHYFIQRLIEYNYQNFFENRKPNKVIYQDVIQFLQAGNTNGLFEKGLQNVIDILTYLYEIKSAINNEELPFATFYKANDRFYYTVLFGQYAAEIGREIIKE